MANLTPYSGTSATRLTAMINKDNRGALRLGIDFTFGLPADFTTDLLDRNTQVVITPVPGTKYKGPETIYYKRLTLDVLNRLPAGYVQPVIVPPGSLSIHDILPRINLGLGLTLTPAEVVDEYFEAEQDSYPLRIVNTQCLAWIDSEFSFVVEREATPPDIALSDAIPNNYLSGLEYHPT